MKKQMIIIAIILIEMISATIVLDKGEIKAQLNIIEKAFEEYIVPDYELEIVDEYIYAMEGFMC